MSLLELWLLQEALQVFFLAQKLYGMHQALQFILTHNGHKIHAYLQFHYAF